MNRLLVGMTCLVLFAAACSSRSSGSSSELLIVVNAPFSTSPAIARIIAQGAELAVDRINRNGGIQSAGAAYTFRLEKLDNGLSPQKALDNVRRAVADGAVAIVDEGTGIDASWHVASQAHVPIGIVYQGGMGLVDAKARPNVFRIAPTDHGMAFRLAEYLIPKGLKIGFIHDDSDYGQQGNAAFQDAFGRSAGAVTSDITVPAQAADPAPQVLQARRSGATALLVWTHSSVVAQVIRAARTAGWDVPIYTAASGEDPVVRQALSDHPDWVDGLTFASGRMTAERGPGPFLAFKAVYERAFGPDEVGVETAASKRVVQPPDYAMYPYDFVNVMAAAIRAANTPRGPAVIDALNQVDVRGANGDERGFNELNHEGLVDDDVYFAVFEDMTFRPVKDDPLSSTLDVIDQTD